MKKFILKILKIEVIKMIFIKNLRNEKPNNPYDFKVDRTSVLGNPYYMFDECMRDEVCNKYEMYFYKKLKTDAAFKSELVKILRAYKLYGKVNLFCWCYPKRCHAETIKKWLEKEIYFNAFSSILIYRAFRLSQFPRCLIH